MSFPSSNNNFPEIRTCRRCRKLLTLCRGISNVCTECEDKDKDDYRIVKEYVQSHANTSAFEVANVTGISVKVIMQFLKEDRLQVAD
ncbi:hypothetical protein [Anaerosporobacter sp.]|uniref:hypothetical protein n=1 Tax=Anaerosporobacter sp. TaxID=1872529 RepID=UPI00286EFD57|nr:hypothetical protein [Anaerosporobacter sp.]